VIIGALLWTLIMINKETTANRTTLGSTFALRIPFAVYFGWVTVATVANISALLVQWGLGDGFWLSAETWTIVVLVVAVAIGSVTALVNSSPSYALVLVWAFWGILSRHISPSEWMGAYPGVIFATQILLPTLALVAVLALVRWARQPVQPILSKRLGA
jgi:hypothetical protein